LKNLQTIGFANIWKEFHYPKNVSEIHTYLNQKDPALLSILQKELFTSYQLLSTQQSQNSQISHQMKRQKPFFISVLMNEKEQLIVLKSWLQFIGKPNIIFS
jgi:hypothetical protein